MGATDEFYRQRKRPLTVCNNQRSANKRLFAI
nr:MAG TPA: hypothetical protein [Caudoviricetes sp.]